MTEQSGNDHDDIRRIVIDGDEMLYSDDCSRYYTDESFARQVASDMNRARREPRIVQPPLRPPYPSVKVPGPIASRVAAIRRRLGG